MTSWYLAQPLSRREPPADMKIIRPIACSIAAACLLLAPISHAQSESLAGKMHEYKDDVSLSNGQIRAGDVCVNFIPVMQSLGFFNGLERIDTPRGSEFRCWKYRPPMRALDAGP